MSFDECASTMQLVVVILSVFLAVSSADFSEPKAAYGKAGSGGYTPKGEYITLDDLTVYCARGTNASEPKVVVWGHDIFGWKSGRTVELVDRLAEEGGYIVLLPDLFRGQEWPDAETYRWETELKFDWTDKLYPFIESLNAASIGTVGTCWGSYLVMHVSADELAAEKVKAGFSIHPSHPAIMSGFGESESEIYDAITAAVAAQWFGPTPEAGDNLRPGGLADQLLEEIEFHEFSSPCDHGFFGRGNITIPEVAECVEIGFSAMLDLFNEYL